MGRKGYRKTWQAKPSRNVEKKWGGVKVDRDKTGGQSEGGVSGMVWYGMVWYGGGEERRGDQVEKRSENEGSGNGQKRG